MSFLCCKYPTSKVPFSLKKRLHTLIKVFQKKVGVIPCITMDCHLFCLKLHCKAHCPSWKRYKALSIQTRLNHSRSDYCFAAQHLLRCSSNRIIRYDPSSPFCHQSVLPPHLHRLIPSIINKAEVRLGICKEEEHEVLQPFFLVFIIALWCIFVAPGVASKVTFIINSTCQTQVEFHIW